MDKEDKQKDKQKIEGISDETSDSSEEEEEEEKEKKPVIQKKDDDSLVTAIRDSIDIERQRKESGVSITDHAELDEEKLTDEPLSKKNERSVKYMRDEEEPLIEIDTPKGIKIKVAVRGDKKKPAIITFHDIGLNHRTCFQGFMNCPSLETIFNRVCVYHINAPGCEDGAKDLPDSLSYTMDDLTNQIEHVAQHFDIERFVGFGVGVGGTVFLHYGLKYPKRLKGLILMSCAAGSTGFGEWTYTVGARLVLKTGGMTDTVKNGFIKRYFSPEVIREEPELADRYRDELSRQRPVNLAKLIHAYVGRSSVLQHVDELECRNFVVICGKESYYYEDMLSVYSKIDPRKKPTLVEVKEAGSLITVEHPNSLKDTLHYFLFGLGM